MKKMNIKNSVNFNDIKKSLFQEKPNSVDKKIEINVDNVNNSSHETLIFDEFSIQNLNNKSLKELLSIQSKLLDHLNNLNNILQSKFN
jgi:hypothetical protein